MMPVPLASTIVPSPSSSMNSPDNSNPYPASTTTATAIIAGILTTATRIAFSDRILITIVQEGRLAQWLQVPLDTSNPTAGDPYFTPATSMSVEEQDGLLPSSHFEPKALLGAASGTGRETLGHLYSSQIASAVKQKEPGEQRTLVLGLGLVKAEVNDREMFSAIVDLILQVL